MIKKALGVVFGILGASIVLCIGTIAVTYIVCPGDSCATDVTEAAEIVEEPGVADAAAIHEFETELITTSEPVDLLRIADENDNAAAGSSCADDVTELSGCIQDRR